MGWCPNCRYDYIEGIQLCPDCGAALVEDPPLQPDSGGIFGPRPDPLRGEWRYLVTSASPEETERLSKMLDAGGVQSAVTYPGHHILESHYQGDHPREGVHLYVPLEQQEQARYLLGAGAVPSPDREKEESALQEEPALPEEAPAAWPWAPSAANANSMLRDKIYHVFRSHGLALFFLFLGLQLLGSAVDSAANSLYLLIPAPEQTANLLRVVAAYLVRLLLQPFTLLGVYGLVQALWRDGSTAALQLTLHVRRGALGRALWFCLLHSFILTLPSLPLLLAAWLRMRSSVAVLLELISLWLVVWVGMRMAVSVFFYLSGNRTPAQAIRDAWRAMSGRSLRLLGLQLSVNWWTFGLAFIASAVHGRSAVYLVLQWLLPKLGLALFTALVCLVNAGFADALEQPAN